MQNEELIELLNNLEKKIYTLVLKCSSLQKQLETAVEENMTLKKTIKNQNIQLKHFQNQENFNKLVTSMMAGEEDSAGLKKKLDEYIIHLDQCINYLNK
ncbi:MAG: hypothetical protein NW226_06585 [Microscillaceae bacterium]|nr:hypothetical protein [Microscillaceae bacterium]